MGQYHILYNIDKGEYVHPHRLGMGLKQREHLGGDASLADVLYMLVMTSPHRGGGDLPETLISGRWAGDRVVVLGDYTEYDDIHGVENAEHLYERAVSGPDAFDISAEAALAIENVWKIKTERANGIYRRVLN